MHMLSSFVAATAFLVSSGLKDVPPQTLVFKIHGKEVSTIEAGNVRGVAEVLVYEPHEKKQVVYKAVPVARIMDEIYGPRWRDEEEILFTCADGYQPSIPVGDFLENDAYLAFRRTDQERFTLDNTGQRETNVELGPFYLIWENIENEKAQVRESAIWPYQVIGMDLVRFEDRFGSMLPPLESRRDSTAGFLAYRRYCTSCHKINGQGGDKARDLNRPNITKIRDPEWLENFISDPHSMRPGIAMAPLDPELENRDQVIRAIVRYLEAMRATGAE